MAEILTFLPGTMCDQRLWQPVWRALGPRFSCDYVPIESAPTRAGMLGLIQSAAAAGDPLHLVAFSMGGYLALQYALDNPGRVASLITVGSSAFGLTPQEAAERIRALELLEKHDYRGMPTSRLHQFVHPSHRSDPAVVDVIRAMDRDLGKPVLVAQLKDTSTRASLAPAPARAGHPRDADRRRQRSLRAVERDRNDGEPHPRRTHGDGEGGPAT